MYYAGHLDDHADSGSEGVNAPGESQGTVTFAGISLANMYANVTGFALLVGMSSAVETLASQQNGAKLYEVK